MIISKKYININDNKMEKIIKYSSLFICVAMTFLSCSCGDEEDSEDAIIDNNPNSGETNYSTTINSKVSATATTVTIFGTYLLIQVYRVPM